LGPAAAWNRGRAAALVERRSAPAVAVLPFVSLSADPADEILARGLPEVTLDRLASVRGLTVIARDSAFAPRKAASAAEIGKMLDARYLVEGSVQRQGTAVRVTARLVEAPTETQLWSATFDRRTGDLFVVQDEIANGVAGALQNRVAGLVKPDPFVPPSRNPDAMLAYLRGRALVGRYTVVEAVAAAEQFERAIALDPRFASALAALYDARMQAASLRAEDLAAARDRNVDLVDRALQLDPRCGAAYFARATWADPKDPRRDDDFRRGVDLEPSHGRGLTAYAEYLYNVNRRDEAQRMLARALTVDPRSPRAYYRRAMQTLPVRGRDIEQEMLQVLQLDPAFYPALQRYAKFRWQHHGEIANAIAIVERAIASDPENPLGRYTAAAFYLDAGDAFAARDVASGTAASAEAARTLVALQARDSKGAAQAALDDSTRSVVPLERWGVVEALRDAALASPPGSPAERALLEKYAAPKNVQDVELLNHRALIFHAHVLQARGRRDEAEAVVRRVLAWAANHEQYGLFHGVRARAYALLGDRDRALQELEASFTLDGDYRQWWYTLDQERMFDAIRVDPRFGRIRDLVARHVAAERARLEELRAKADLPPRDGRRTQRGVVVASGSGAGR
jgi:TolB-like protein/Tfp pilus assembly protein PilF